MKRALVNNNRDASFAACFALQSALEQCEPWNRKAKFSILKKYMPDCLPVFSYLWHPQSDWGGLAYHFDLIEECFEKHTEKSIEKNPLQIESIFDLLDCLEHDPHCYPREIVVKAAAAWCIRNPSHVIWLQPMIQKSKTGIQLLLGPNVSLMAIQFAMETCQRRKFQ